MIIKKSEKANLEKRRGVFIQLGVVIALAITLIAFEWTSKPKNLASLGAMSDMNLTEEIIPITRQQEIKPPPPPAAPKVTDVLNIVEDDVQIDDELIIDDAEADQQMQVEIVEFTETEEVAEEEGEHRHQPGVVVYAHQRTADSLKRGTVGSEC